MSDKVAVEVDKKWLIVGVVALVIIAGVLAWQFILRPAARNSPIAALQEAAGGELQDAKRAALDELEHQSKKNANGEAFAASDLEEISRDEFFDDYAAYAESGSSGQFMQASDIPKVRTWWAKQDLNPKSKSYYFKFQTQEDAENRTVTSIAVYRIGETESREEMDSLAEQGRQKGDWYANPFWSAQTPK